MQTTCSARVFVLGHDTWVEYFGLTPEMALCLAALQYGRGSWNTWEYNTDIPHLLTTVYKGQSGKTLFIDYNGLTFCTMIEKESVCS